MTKVVMKTICASGSCSTAWYVEAGAVVVAVVQVPAEVYNYVSI